MTMTTLLPVLWLSIVLAAIFCEAAFENWVAIWCAPAGLCALISGIWLEAWQQTAVFAAALTLMLTVRSILRRRFH
ncbi:MAG: hypothetical protein IJ493_12345 [Clostridia bacterium]|nr:hypothetical protein [Clostridia bacterium]